MGSVNPPAYHCIVCTLAKIPFASLSKESQQRIVRNGRPTTQMPFLRARYMNSINLDVHDWMTGCDREKKLYCWPCLLFNTTEYDVWGKRGFSDFSYLSCSRQEHLKDVSHQAKSKTLKLWIETAAALSESSGEEDVECIPELDFLNASASELDEELDVKPNVEALNASMSFSRDLVAPPADPDDTVVDGGSAGVTGSQNSATRSVECGKDVRTVVLDVVGEKSHASNRSSPTGVGRCPSSADSLARLYKKASPEPPSATMSHTVQNGTEKYQLKWHSHHQNINVSLSNLYKNDRYADVMLLTCNGEENYTIPAHKLILGTSSLYFANIFDKTTVPTNAVTYIVLPPDLTYRSMQVLIQYMYTGESTVTNDILNEVLRGGEILKIRGLWRNDCAKSSGADAHTGDASARFVSPVTVTMPPQTSSHQHQSQSTPFLQVNRDVAIDPAERRRTVSVEGTISSRTSSVQNQEHVLHRQEDPTQRNEEDHSIQHRLQITLQQPHEDRRKDHVKRRTPSGGTASSKCSTGVGGSADATLSIPQELSFLDVKAEPVEWSDLRAGELSLPENGAAAASKNVEEGNNGEPADPGAAIKSEGCAEFPTGSTRSSTTPSPSPSTEQPTYSPLTCELCSETFTIPGEWVRHIEGHSEMTQNQPKRRRRTEEPTDETAALRCDLCATYYVTPADWVRHVQNTHTERELAASNNRALAVRRTCSKRDNSTTAAPGGEATSQQEKLCNICNKTFPSYASMAIHKRTHTGEKPFHCELCNKGFNVKSNLHRHMRTVHNQQDDMGPISSNTDRDSCSSD
uniref:BTB domain-containing protein n=1 Tax=Anopheles atroparvus TaxID=41427 RepID=A0AAG5D2H5_ANOAO